MLYQTLQLGSTPMQLSFSLYYFNGFVLGPDAAPIHQCGPKVSICSPLTPLPCGEPVFCSPSTLEIGGEACNQQYRVDILRKGAKPFSTSPNDVLMTLFQTQPGDPFILPPTTMTFNLKRLLGGVVLRFAEADNHGPLAAAVDDVRLTKLKDAVTTTG